MIPRLLNEEALDHLLLGAPTLEAGIAWLEEKTGVRAAMGGSHPGLGTWNALASLGPSRYLEIIAPDPAQPSVETFYVPGLRDFAEPKIATWAARGRDLEKGFIASLPSDFSCGPARRGRRLRPDGTELAWTLVFPRHRTCGAFDGALPFLIEWESPKHHPANTAPAGLILRALAFTHPESAKLRHAFTALGIDGAIQHAETASIRVELDTPRGVVLLST